jgi:hypothetical protein
MATTKPRPVFGKPALKINKKLDFDSCSEDDLPRSSSPDQHKKLIFDDSEEDFELSDGHSSPIKFVSKLVHNNLSPIQPGFTVLSPAQPTKTDSSLLELSHFNSSGIESNNNSDKFSPCRTRSGKIYTSVEKRRVEEQASTAAAASVVGATHSASKLPTPVFIENRRSSSRHCSGASGGIATPKSTHIQTSHLRVQEVQLNLLQKDLSQDLMDVDEPACVEPPPLNYIKRPVSRLLHNQVDRQHAPATPSVSLHSPPTNEVKAMRLFDKSPVLGSSPVAAATAPRHAFAPKSRLLFGCADESQPRRISAPGALRVSFGPTEAEASLKRKRVANINPFTPTSMLASLKKKYRSEPQM